MTHQRVETYSVYGGIDDNSLASPKSAILRTSFVTSKFSLEKKRNLIINLLTKSRNKNMQYEIWIVDSTNTNGNFNVKKNITG